MPKFNKSSIQSLKEFLYYSTIHDARIESIEFGHGKDAIYIKLRNPIFNVNYCFTFEEIELVLATKGNAYESAETIVSLTVEEDFSCLQPYLPKRGVSTEAMLYLLFQTFSGSEVHIVSKWVNIESLSTRE